MTAMKLGLPLLGILAPLPLSAVTVTLPAIADTSLFENKPDSDLGGTSLVAGTNQQYSRSRALFRFDVSSLPVGAVITGVQVSLYCFRQPDPDQHGGPVDSNFNLYRMFVAWGEGAGSSATGSTAGPGAATWNERLYGTAGWTSPGGEIGMDFADVPSATASVGGVGNYTWTSGGLIQDVNGWLADPASNYGYLLASDAETALGSGRRFGSRELPGGATPPPRLLVTFDIPEPSAPLLALAGAALFLTRRPDRPRSTSFDPDPPIAFP